MRVARFSLLVAFAVASAIAIVPSAASAATITYANQTLTYTAATGEENALSVGTVSGNKLEFFENGLGVNVAFPGPRCQRNLDPQYPTAVIVDCSAASVNKITVLAGDLGDTVDLSNGQDAPTATPMDAEIRGGSGDDDLTGGTGNDSVYGELGDDLNIDGYEGQDMLDGGPGVDTLQDTGAGLDDNDKLYGQAGGDVDNGMESLSSGDGSNDFVDGGSGDDEIQLGSGDNAGGGTALGGVGEDSLTGGQLASKLDGGSNNDALAGGGSDDNLIGGSGDDDLTADGGTDLMDGGVGKDTFHLSSGVGIVDYSARTNAVSVEPNVASNDGETTEKDTVDPEVQGVIGGSASDTLVGSDIANNVLIGGGGNDTLNAAGGTDLLNGGPGADKLNGGAGNHDTVDYTGATSALSVDLDGEQGDDGVAGEGDTVGADVEDVLGGSGANTLTGNDADNVLVGNDAVDALDGGNGNDSLVAFKGNDTLTGGPGNDGVSGGIGADTMDGGTGVQDYVDYSDHLKAVVVDLDGKVADDGGVEDMKHDTVLGFEGVVGGAANDKITAGKDSIANSFVGGSGNDRIDGKDGNDVIDGSSGKDRITGGNGDDKIIGGNNKDQVTGGNGDDRFLMNYDFEGDRMSCGAGTDYLRNKLGHRTIDIGGVDKTTKDCEQSSVPADDGPADWWRTPATMSESLFEQ